MKLSNIFPQYILMFFKYTFVISYQSNLYNMGPYQPVEYVDFNLLSGDKSELSHSRYDLVDDFGSRSSGLPLLSRGIRDIEDSDDSDDDFDDNISIPSCSELRKMWRIARRIHHQAIQTNEIPQKLHPFSNFESDRFRAERRLHKGKSINKDTSSSRDTSSLDTSSSSGAQQGSKEVASDANYGTIRYAPSDPVKRPGSTVYDVLRKLNPDVVYRSNKDPGAWNTGIIEFEPESEETRPFDKLRNKLRKDKSLPPIPEKSASKNKNYWGVRKVISHYKNKGRQKSNVDLVRDQLLSDKPAISSRLNYRDESSGAIQTGGIVPSTSFGRQLGRKKSFRQKNKKERKKIREIQKVLSSHLRNQMSRAAKKRKQKNRGKKKLRRKSSEYTRNFLFKGK